MAEELVESPEPHPPAFPLGRQRFPGSDILAISKLAGRTAIPVSFVPQLEDAIDSFCLGERPLQFVS